MLRITRILLFICILSLVVVSIGGHFNFFPEQFGEMIKSNFGLFAGLASIIGLLAFTLPKTISSTDFEKEELEKLRSLLHTAQELEKIEDSKNKTEQQLIELAHQKKTIELSVKRAGLVLFYRDQLEKSITSLFEMADKNEELSRLFEKVRDSMSRLNTLDEEIEEDPNLDLIKEIIAYHDYQEKRDITLFSIIENTIDEFVNAFKI